LWKTPDTPGAPRTLPPCPVERYPVGTHAEYGGPLLAASEGHANALALPTAAGRAVWFQITREGRTMSDFQITCVNKKLYLSGHEHIEWVGVAGEKSPVSVGDVYRLMNARHRFYTVSPSTGATALVEPLHCCHVDTLRSAPDAVRDNNLDNLPTCR